MVTRPSGVSDGFAVSRIKVVMGTGEATRSWRLLTNVKTDDITSSVSKFRIRNVNGYTPSKANVSDDVACPRKLTLVFSTRRPSSSRETFRNAVDTVSITRTRAAPIAIVRRESRVATRRCSCTSTILRGSISTSGGAVKTNRITEGPVILKG